MTRTSRQPRVNLSDLVSTSVVDQSLPDKSKNIEPSENDPNSTFPSIQSKVDIFNPKNDNSSKRKNDGSPDQTATKQEKKKIKDQAKSLRKQKDLEKKQVLVSPLSPKQNGY